MNKRWEGSYTVEIALLMPVILLTLLLPIYMAYDMFAEVQASSEYYWDEEFCAEEIVRGMRVISFK